MQAKNVSQSGIPYIIKPDGARKVSQLTIDARVDEANLSKMFSLRALDLL